jgi:hypothetical protein
MSIRHSRSARLAAAVSSALAIPFYVGSAALVGLAVPVTAHAQETTTQIIGLVQDGAGQPLPEATVRITHVPSGSVSTSRTNVDGRFSASGLRPGGPYRVEFEAPGFTTRSVPEVFTQLGKPSALNVVMEGGEVLAEVTSVATRQTVEVGVSSTFDAARISQTASFQRDLKDIVRLDPKIVLDPANQNAIQIAGTSNRFNSITIDGVRQSDDFGLNNNGYPTTRAPVSLDAIEAVSVQTAPYNLEYSGFQGGNINVVTRSGTNEFSGSAYYFYNSNDLAGDKSKGQDISLSFEEKNYGGTLGGPIIKDKLFFFLSYEQIDLTAPVPIGPAGSSFANQVTQVPQSVYDQVVAISRNVYNFDPLETPSDLPEEDKKALVKIDWQINDDHRAVLQYQYNEGNTVVQNNSSVTNRIVASPSNWYDRPIEQDVYTLQLFSTWSDAFSTEFKAGRKKNDTAQVPLQDLQFSELQVCLDPGAHTNNACSGGAVVIGPDIFRHANELTNDLDTIKLKGTYLLGSHSISAGIEYEKLDVFNLFVSSSRGQYFFNGVTNFQNRQAVRFNYQNAFTNDATDGAAEFSYDTTALYLQDRWEVTPDLTLTYGVRFEQWSSSDIPNFNQGFATRYGYANTETLDGRDLTLPRFGFNWQATERTTVRGGVGRFGGGAPNVWISNSFSQDGVTVTSQQINRPTTGTSPTPLQQVLFNVDPNGIPNVVLQQQTTLRGNGSVNAIDPNFNIPSSWRYSLGFDRFTDLGWLGDEYRFSLEGIFTQVSDAVLWRDARLVRTATAPDGRPIYGYRPSDPSSGPNSRPTNVNDLVLANTPDGTAFVVTADVSKTWETSAGTFDGYLGYTYQDSRDVNSGTSSTALSNWDNLATSDPNNPGAATSNYETKHRIALSLNWKKAFFGDYYTGAGVFVERRAGQPFSYTFGSGTTIFGDPRQGARQRQLFYVPTGPNDPNVVIAAPSATQTLTWDNLNAFIDGSGLGKYRGQIAPRNAFNSPWATFANIRLSQEVPAFFEGAKAVVSLDIINVANLINNDWGRFSQVGFPYVAPVANASLDAQGRYVYSSIPGVNGPRGPVYDLRDPAVSVWRMSLGFRIQF